MYLSYDIDYRLTSFSRRSSKLCLLANKKFRYILLKELYLTKVLYLMIYNSCHILKCHENDVIPLSFSFPSFITSYGFFCAMKAFTWLLNKYYITLDSYLCTNLALFFRMIVHVYHKFCQFQWKWIIPVLFYCLHQDKILMPQNIWLRPINVLTFLVTQLRAILTMNLWKYVTVQKILQFLSYEVISLTKCNNFLQQN